MEAEEHEMQDLVQEQPEDEEMDPDECDLDEEDESDEEEEANRLLVQIKEVKDKISLNPFDYDSYLRLIELCKIAGDLDELRAARERMSAAYPLTPELWLSWLDDEIKYKQNDDDNPKILELFERAVKDYLSVEVWLEYVRFVIGLHSQSGVDTKKIFEQALTSVGLHPTKGHQIWQVYRMFEQMMVEFEEDKEKQLKLVFSLFQRQLSIPNIDLDNTYKEFQNWNSDLIKSHPEIKFDCTSIEPLYLKSSTEMSNILPFEQKLVCEKPALTDYFEYLDYEIKAKNPSRVKFLFERAITDHCLEADLWLRYVKYLREHLNFYDLIVAVLRRAVRNVTWSAELWIDYIRTVERFERPGTEVQEVFERSLTAALPAESDYGKLWLCYLEFRRRKTNFDDLKQVEQLRKNFLACTQHLAAMPTADQFSAISIFEAKIEAKFCSNIARSREIWEAIMENHKVLGANQVNYWLEYADLERLYGSSEHYKKIMLRALGFCPESYDLLSGQLIRYFKEESNDIKQIDAIEKSVLGVFERVVKRYREKQRNKQETKAPEAETRGTKRKEIAPMSDFKSNKKSRTEPLAKQPVHQAKSVAGPSNIEFPKKPESDVNKLYSICVKNLDYKLTKERIEAEFSKFGKIKEVRLITNFDHQSKGYCFIEFTTIEAVKNALKHDRMLIDNRPAYICEMDVKTEFKYKTELEKNKLFVSKLDRKVTQDQLTKIFEKFNGFQEVRLATYPHGQSKCHAYVDFKTDQDAANALLMTDGIEIEKKKISVAISNPPKKKEKKNQEKALGDAIFKRPILG